MLVAKNFNINAGDARETGSSTCLGPRTWCRALIPALHLSPSLDSLPPLPPISVNNLIHVILWNTSKLLQIPHLDKQQLHSSHCSDQTLRAILSIFVSVTPHMQFTSKSWLYPEPRCFSPFPIATTSPPPNMSPNTPTWFLYMIAKLFQQTICLDLISNSGSGKVTAGNVFKKSRAS